MNCEHLGEICKQCDVLVRSGLCCVCCVRRVKEEASALDKVRKGLPTMLNKKLY